MRVFKKIILVSSLLMSASVFSHSDGHGTVNAGQVIELAQASAKLLSFKDRGMSVGKVDDSWAVVTKENFDIVEGNESNYIVKAVNAKTKQVLYFMISKNGEVKDVIDGSVFNRSHGHSH